MSKERWEQPELPFDPPISRPDPMRYDDKWKGGNVHVNAYPSPGTSIESRLRTLEKDVHGLHRLMRDIQRRLG